MTKRKLLALMAILALSLTGCGAEPEPLSVYSFSGENACFSVSNGVIVLTETEEIFSGGDLKTGGEAFENIASYSATFYILSRDEKQVILSTRVEDMTGGAIPVSGDLGQGSGDGIVTGAKAEYLNDLKNNLYFELTTVDLSGAESVYQLQMSLTEITNDAEAPNR